VTPIICEKGQHVLGAAPNDEAVQDYWEYCCNCQNFWRITPDEKAVAQCPVCERSISARYLCNYCNTLSLDSLSAAKGREFYLSLEGVPLPSCPGCLKKDEKALLEHECEAFSAAFTTARETCPFCHEKLAAAFSFPASVSEYLKEFTGDKLEVGFDTESRQLVKASPGDFLLLQARDGSQGNMVLPSRARFATQQEFFRHYKDYYDCDEPAAGEVIVLSPAIVQKEGRGWSLKELGRLRINTFVDLNNEERTHNVTAAFVDKGTDILKSLPVCPKCRATAKLHHRFCKKCGAAITNSDNAAPENLHNVGEQAPLEPAHTYRASSSEAVAESDAGIQQAGRSKGKTWVVLSVTGLALLVGILLFASGKSGSSVEGKLNDAISRGNLISPPGESAYELYAQLRREGASQNTLTDYKEKLLPRLTARPQALLDQMVSPDGTDGTLSDWDEAQKLLAWAAELKPEDKQLAAKAAYCEGRAAYLRNRMDAAISAYQRAADLDKSWATPLNSLGVLLNERRRYSEARNYLTEAIRRNPKWALPYNNLGTAYFFDNDIYDAQVSYEKARDLAPNWPRPHAWLGSIAKKQNDYCTAKDEFEKALSLSTPNMSSWNPQKIQKDLDEARTRCAGDSVVEGE
jgi:tetratricopeptide (TPR) repeat protein/ribosomal protein L32